MKAKPLTDFDRWFKTQHGPRPSRFALAHLDKISDRHEEAAAKSYTTLLHTTLYDAAKAAARSAWEAGGADEYERAKKRGQQ